jgi:photosystem II stability/assembly factor-like uncharacterized protein
MKTALKYLTIAGLAIAALALPLFKVSSIEEEAEAARDKDEFKASGVNATAEERAQDAEEGVAGRQAYRRLQLQDENGEIPPDAWIKAYQEKEAMPFLPEAWSEFTASGAEAPNPWVSIGPGNIGGRIRSILIHPLDPDTMWVGGVSGGVWKTTDGGLTSWSTNTDLLENLAVTCMAMDSTGPEITLYAGTGEGFIYPNAVDGNGIFKSTDGGNHWTRLQSTANNPDFRYVNRLAICPTNAQILLAATVAGIFRSTDGGDNWSRSSGYGNLRDWVDVRFRPGSAVPPGEQVSYIDCLASSVNGYLFYSNDNGATWERNTANQLPSPAFLRRLELGYSRSDPRIVYASTGAVGNEPSGLFYSENGGYTFTSLEHPQDPNNPKLPGALWYTNVLWVDPTDPDTVVVGGIYILRTKDRGAHWEEAGSGSHLDQHIIVEHPGYTGASGGNKVAFCGSDGGIHRTEDILVTITPRPPGGSVRWTSRNNALGVTQFYGGAGNAITGKIIGGAQDNGTLRYEGDAEDWHVLKGALSGDGGFCAADQVGESERPNYYGEAPNLQIYRSNDGAISKQYIIDNPVNGIPRNCGGVPCALFVAPFVLDPNNRERILAGSRSLWRTNNATVDNPLDVCWAEIKQQRADLRPISAIAVAAADPNLIWVGYVDGSVFYTTDGTAGAECPSPSPTPSWNSGDSGQVLPEGRTCTRITIAPPQPTDDPQAVRPVYVTFGGFPQSNGNVWKRDSNGAWSDVHHNLPKLPVYSLVISPSNPHFLYVGTELGVFASSDDGAHWSPANGGPANTQVVELFWMGPRLVAVTNGRGMFVLPPSPQ